MTIWLLVSGSFSEVSQPLIIEAHFDSIRLKVFVLSCRCCEEQIPLKSHIYVIFLEKLVSDDWSHCWRRFKLDCFSPAENTRYPRCDMGFFLRNDKRLT